MGNEIHYETDIVRVEEIYENQKNGNKKKEVIFEEEIVKTEGKSHMLHGIDNGRDEIEWRCGQGHNYIMMTDDLLIGLFSSKNLKKYFFLEV